jgi:hypothetical protein
VAFRPGTTELIAASPYDTLALGPGELSFTTALITELKAQAEKGELFSVAELHIKVLVNIIKQRTGPKVRITRTQLFPSISPVYVRLVGGAEVPSIGLMPLCGAVTDINLVSMASGSSRSLFNSTDALSEDFAKTYRAQKEAQTAREAAGRSEGKQWKLREYKEKQALKIERRKKRLGVFDWKKIMMRGNTDGAVDLQNQKNESPEIVVSRLDPKKGGFSRSVEGLRDLVLRVPMLQGCDL